MKIYLAGPMRGIKDFNYPAFHAAAAKLRAEGHEVFSPAEHDHKIYGKDISNPAGDARIAAEQHGFDIRAALADDCDFICRHADALYMLPGWERSKGAKAERALAKALNIEIIYPPIAEVVAS